VWVGTSVWLDTSVWLGTSVFGTSVWVRGRKLGVGTDFDMSMLVNRCFDTALLKSS
jgi:hypothetical protein